MDRREFLVTVPILPTLAVAPPLPEDEKEIRKGKYLVRVPAHSSITEHQRIGEAIKNFLDSDHRIIVIDDNVKIYRID